jgi:hypothetical protein
MTVPRASIDEGCKPMPSQEFHAAFFKMLEIIRHADNDLVEELVVAMMTNFAVRSAEDAERPHVLDRLRETAAKFL